MSRSNWLQRSYLDRMEVKRCELCGKKGKLEAHHIIPVCLGGGSTDDNFIGICASCHAKLTPRAELSRVGQRMKKGAFFFAANRAIEEFWNALDAYDGCFDYQDIFDEIDVAFDKILSYACATSQEKE